MDYDGIKDEEVLQHYRAGQIDALEYLLNKYKNLVRSKIRTYFLTGADSEDIIQEGMIGLFKAIRDYSPDRQASFRSFAELCVTRQIITAVKTSTRQKHLPLNNYISLNKAVYDENSEKSLLDVLTGDEENDPENLFIIQENMGKLYEKINTNLSTFEKKVLRMYLDGLTYQQIAGQLNRQVKSVDNALQRVKKKLEAGLKESEKTD